VNCDNAKRAESRTATLTVNSSCTPVSIGSHPSNQTIIPGTTAAFSVLADGTGPFSYFWYKNGNLLAGENSPSYTTPTLSSSDNGNYYYCQVSNCDGKYKIISNYAYLTLAPIQKTLTTSSIPSVGGKTTGGGTYQYNQVVTVSAIPNAGYKFINWTSNGVQVSNNASYSFNIIDEVNLIANFNRINTPKIYVDLNSISIFQQSKKSALIHNKISYKITENDFVIDKNRSGLAARVIIPESLTDDWRQKMLEKYDLNNNIPTFIDWSIFDSPVKNQNPCGSCWAFAAIALIENLANQNNLLPVPNFSEQQMVSCVPNTSCTMGGHPWWAFNYIKNNGLIVEDCFPYTATNNICSNQCLNPSEIINISQFTEALWGDATVDNLKLALLDGPLAVEMYTTSSFHSYRGGIIDYKNDNYFWGHAVLLVGYDDNLQCFKVKNSWGTTWGENGYFRVSYDDVTDGLKFGTNASYARGVYITEQNEAVSKSFTIKNLGEENLVLTSITSDKQWLEINSPTATLIPSASTIVTISISDWNLISDASAKATVTINSNDPVEPKKYVTVKAQKSVNSIQPQLVVSTNFYQDRELPKKDGSIAINVGSIGQELIKWDAETDDSWLNMSTVSGINDGLITVNCSMNNTGKSRTGYVRISSDNVSNSPQIVSITQNTNNMPVISDINIAVENKSDTIYFKSSDFINHFTDSDGNTLKYIKIVTFPINGILKINDFPVVSNQVIMENDIHNLIFIPNTGWGGNINFEYNASDGTNYALNNAFVNSNITSIQAGEESKILRIYPNPTSDILTIEGLKENERTELALYNINSKLVKVQLSYSSITKMDISDVVSGVYLLVINNQFDKAFKIIKK
jgi:C1A family cysteine protease